MIGGLIVVGPDSARILFRAVGPSLASAGVQQPLADPNLDLFNTQGVKIGTNDNWKDAQVEAIQATNAAPPTTWNR